MTLGRILGKGAGSQGKVQNSSEAREADFIRKRRRQSSIEELKACGYSLRSKEEFANDGVERECLSVPCMYMHLIKCFVPDYHIKDVV